MSKIIVGMSGGVDSAVAAYLLKIAGHDVTGVTLRTWLSSAGKESRCCEIEDARKVAWELDIPYYVVNCLAEFEKYVTEPFVDDYIKGRTPNPCTRCNRYVKWDKMIEAARVMGADYIATGHYANVVKTDEGRYTFKKAIHTKKDQTYMLYALKQAQVASTLMPLGGLTKDQVRDIAAKAGLPVASKADSQEICFVSRGMDYTDYIEETARSEIQGPGNFVDENGIVLGIHQGIIHYTVGQRKGLGLALGYPAYVKEIRADRNEVVIAKEEDIYSKVIICKDVNLMSVASIDRPIHCSVKIRYQHQGQGALVEMIDEDSVRISFDEEVKAPAPGQAAVFYDEEDRIIGGGIISSVEY